MADETLPAVAQPSSLAQMFGGGGQMLTSLDLKMPAHRQLMLSCLNDCNYRITEQVNKTIHATNYFAHMVPIEDEDTGEVNMCGRLVVIDKDGKTWECVSVTLGRSLAAVAFAQGEPPWKTPLKLGIRSKKKGERSIYWFELEK